MLARGQHRSPPSGGLPLRQLLVALRCRLDQQLEQPQRIGKPGFRDREVTLTSGPVGLAQSQESLERVRRLLRPDPRQGETLQERRRDLFHQCRQLVAPQGLPRQLLDVVAAQQHRREEKRRQQSAVRSVATRRDLAVERRQDLAEVSEAALARRHHGVGLGQDHLEHSEIQHPLHGLAGAAAAQQLRELLGDASRRSLGRAPAAARGSPLDSTLRCRNRGGRRTRRRAAFAPDPRESAPAGRRWSAAGCRFRSSDAADVVEDREVGDVVEQGIDREVAPEGVLDRGAEVVVAGDQQLAGRRPRRSPPPRRAACSGRSTPPPRPRRRGYGPDGIADR